MVPAFPDRGQLAHTYLWLNAAGEKFWVKQDPKAAQQANPARSSMQANA